jgi:hypothetical protein
MMNDVVGWISAHAGDMIVGAVAAWIAIEVSTVRREIRDYMREMRLTLREIRDSLRR